MAFSRNLSNEMYGYGSAKALIGRILNMDELSLPDMVTIHKHNENVSEFPSIYTFERR